MLKSASKKPSQSEKIRNFLSEAPADYTFTVTRLTKELKNKVPGLSNGGVSGFVAKLAARGIIQKIERQPGEKAATFKVVGDLLGYNTRSKAGAGSLPGRTLKHRAAEFVQAEAKQIAKSTPFRTQQDIIDDMVNLMAELGNTPVNLTSVPTEALLKELMARETRKETK